jgi:hypothetical protein
VFALKTETIIMCGDLNKRRDELVRKYWYKIEAAFSYRSGEKYSATQLENAFCEGFDAGVTECHAMLEQIAGALENVVTQFEDMSDSNDIREHWHRVSFEALADYRKWKGGKSE